MLTASLICAAIAAASVEGNVVDENPRSISHYARELGPGANMNLTRQALRWEDVERWHRILTASEAQVQFVETMYRRFVQRHNEFMDREAPEFLRLGRELDDLMREDMSNRDFLTALIRMNQANDRLMRGLIAIEHELIADFEPVLAEEQQARLDIIRWEARRRNCRTNSYFARWSNIELREVWEDLLAALPGPAERQAVEEILVEYEVQLTSHVCNLADALLRTRRRLTESRIANLERPAAAPQTPQEARRRIQRIMSELVDGTQRIRLLHEHTLNRIAAELPGDVASAFIRAAKDAAFPELYPDDYAIHALFDSLLLDEDLDEELKDGVQDIYEVYAADYQKQCSDLEAFAIEWGKKNTAGVNGYQTQLFPAALEPRLAQRRALSFSHLNLIEEIVGTEALGRHAKLFPRQDVPPVFIWPGAAPPAVRPEEQPDGDTGND